MVEGERCDAAFDIQPDAIYKRPMLFHEISGPKG